jgi:hypothetical protein
MRIARCPSRRSDAGLDMKFLDPQWLDPEGRKSKPIVVKLEMTLDLEEVEKLATWLGQPYVK